MYRVEVRIAHSELIKHGYFSLNKPLPYAYRELLWFLNGMGTIERFSDVATLEEVMVGVRNDDFPWQAWPEEVSSGR